jgi:hypothetical protein
MGIITINREISQANTLSEALQTLSMFCVNDHLGMLSVEFGNKTGYMAISKGVIRGASIPLTGEQGMAAFDHLLKVSPGTFKFAVVEEVPAALSNQDLRIDIASLVASSPPKRPVLTKIIIAIPAGAKKPAQEHALSLHRSLTPDQLKLLATYRQLNGPMDRAAFWKQNAELAGALEGGLTEAQKKELAEAHLGDSEASAASFLEFHRQALGDAADVSEEQIAMVRDLYRELQIHEKRLAFLKENELLDERLGVARGAELWAQEEAERVASLDSIQAPQLPGAGQDNALLVATDYYGAETEKPTLSLSRQTGGMAIPDRANKWWQRTEVVGIGVSVVIAGLIGFLGFTYLSKTSYIEGDLPEQDMVSMDDVMSELLNVEVPRVANNQQVLLLIGGGSQQGGGSAGERSMKYWSEQAQVARRMMVQKRFKEAGALLTNVVNQDPYDVTARQSLIESYLALGKRNEARAVAISGLAYSRQKEDRLLMESMFMKCIGDSAK